MPEGVKGMTYRPDIDGLRAVAIAAVVLFHAGLAPFSGGFVGVDIFFVISGYLITAIIAKDLQEGRFSLVAFYERRIRRIVPALVVMVLVVSIAATAILLPHDLQGFGRSIAATALFASNILFWREAGYFAAPAEAKPLLHGWSLSIEEQFYLVFPVAILLLQRWPSSCRLAAIAGAAALSLAAGIWAVAASPEAAFYLAPFRFWELLLGALLALGACPPITSRRLNEACAWLGAGLVIWSVAAFSAATPFPGAAALVPCLGALLLIHSGSGGTTGPARFLSQRALVALGILSYSLYLWHWPLLVLVRYWKVEALDVVETMSVLGLSLAAACASHRFVERPFRRGLMQFAGRPLFLAAGTAMAAIVAFANLAVLSGGWPGRLSDSALALAQAVHDSSPDRKRCHASDRNPIRYAEKCRHGAAGGPATIAIWGDSHAAELAPALAQSAAAAAQVLIQISYSDCPPALAFTSRQRPTCARHNAQMLSALAADSDIHTVLLVARHSRAYREEGQAFFGEFARVAKSLAAAGKRVVLVYPIPEYSHSVPLLLARLDLRDGDLETAGMPRSDFERQSRPLVRQLDLIAGKGIFRIRPADLLCDTARCRAAAAGRPLYFDDDHLSVAGARFIAPLFADVFAAAPRALPPARRS